MATEVPSSDRESVRAADGREPPIDLDHLGRQTGGDQDLAREVLTLFVTRSLVDLDRLKATPVGEERREAAHLIAGSARAIGAGNVARLAAAVEQGAHAETRSLAELEAAVAEARDFASGCLARWKSGGV